MASTTPIQANAAITINPPPPIIDEKATNPNVLHLGHEDNEEPADEKIITSTVLRSKFADLSKWETVKTFKRLYATQV